MRWRATLRGLSAKKHEAVDTGAGYLVNRQSFLRDDVFLEPGFPIATGVIEGTCRHLVKERMDLTGARWRLTSAEAVLKLRSLRSQGVSKRSIARIVDCAPSTLYAWLKRRKLSPDRDARRKERHDL